MGRFYRTANTTPVDYMYRINSPLMEKVLSANEGYISQELGQNDVLHGLTKFNRTASDNDAANKISTGYDTQIDDLTSQITKDPANWRKQMQPIKDLTRTIQNDYTNGPISKYVSNYNTRKEAFDNLDAQQALYEKSGGQDKDGNIIGISPARVQLAKQYMDSNFKGTNYNPDTKSADPYNTINLGHDIDVHDRLAKGLDKLKEDGYSFTNDDITKGGQYFNKVTKESKSISPEKIQGILMDRLGGDSELMDYLKQDQQIGHIRGIFYPKGSTDSQGNDLSGRFIAPYNLKGLSQDELNSVDHQREIHQQQINNIKDPASKQQAQEVLNNSIDQLKNKRTVNWSNDSYLSPILQSIIGEFSHSDTKQSNELKANPIWSTQFTQAQENNRQANSLNSAWRIHADTQKGIDDRFKENLDWEKYKFDNPQEKVSSSKSSGKGAVVDANAPQQSMLSDVGNNTLRSLTVKDPDSNMDIPLMSNKGIVTNWRQLGEAQNVIDQQLKHVSLLLKNTQPETLEYNKILSLKESLQKQSLANKTELDRTASWNKQTEDAVLSNDPQAGTPLTPDEISTYKEFAKNGDIHGVKFQAYIDKLKQQYPDVKQPISKDNFIKYGLQKIYNVNEDRSVEHSVLRPWARNVLTSVQDANKEYLSIESKQVQDARAKLANFYKAQGNIIKNKDTYLKNLSTDYITSDAIVPSKIDADAIRNILLTDPSGSVVVDGINGENLSNSKVSSARHWGITGGTPSKDYSMSFEGDNNIKNYLQETGTTMNIDKIGKTTGIGNGTAVLKVSFNDPTGKLPAGKPYYISVNNNTATAMGNRFKSSKDQGISNFGNDMLDGYSNNIKNQFAKGANTILTTDGQGNTIPLDIHKLDNGKIMVSYKTSTGKVLGFPRVKDLKGNSVGGLDGIYTNIDDFISHLKEQINLHNTKN